VPSAWFGSGASPSFRDEELLASLLLYSSSWLLDSSSSLLDLISLLLDLVLMLYWSSSLLDLVLLPYWSCWLLDLVSSLLHLGTRLLYSEIKHGGLLYQ